MNPRQLETDTVTPSTAERVQQAAPILDRYNEQLHREGAFNTYSLEFDLREAWGLGYQALKQVMTEIMQDFVEYEHLAAYFAEFSNRAMMPKSELPFYERDPRKMCVISEFKQPLAELYGASNWDHDETLAQKRKHYWQQLFAEQVALSSVSPGK
jgi:hypothetical protein